MPSLKGIPGWTIYVMVLFSVSQFLLLVLILILAYKLNRLAARIDEVSRHAGKFVRMGMSFFKTHGKQ